ncbi:tyrosine-type recombinase/integrase [Brevibacterium aurantiacum]|uniref:Integrase n=1 Tax=Brevibacterium aurantiacum TaxID=273384 RepID=A0A1D7W7S0_BREAU|nr:tyrosine-type recombinase/integrase [Brevibacterium aurantiacum]AOP55051.1 Integrase [Brevibacterium aurantiacum]RCS99395.1 site-specific integrase [Brevibacterium aurantiacum]
MATINRYATRSGQKRYRVLYVDETGRRTQKRGFTTKASAEQWMSDTVSEVSKGTYIKASAGKTTVGELWDDWYARKSGIKASTRRRYEIAWRIHAGPVWAKRQIGTIRPSEVADWVSTMTTAGKGATTIEHAHLVLRGVLEDAVKDRLIPSNPAADPGNLPRKAKRSRVYLSHAEVQAIAEAAEGQWSALVYLACYTGLRWGEMAGLRVRHLDLLRKRINVEANAVEVGSKIVEGTPKSHERRSVPVPDFLVELLARQCEGKGHDDLVFTGPRTGKFIVRPKNERSWFTKAMAEAGVKRDLSPHDFRHTAASLAVSAGANVKVVQRMLGHASAAMTLDTYADLFDDDLEAVSSALDAQRTQQLSANVRQ